ncbi:MAG: hypothetical protein IT361_18620 [Gemmatimonadaceae bacterium]|nr:hypothetical protein [Gemmatimonadaceae bacterium]
MRVTSGYRTSGHNAAVAGSETSSHVVILRTAVIDTSTQMQGAGPGRIHRPDHREGGRPRCAAPLPRLSYFTVTRPTMPSSAWGSHWK